MYDIIYEELSSEETAAYLKRMGYSQEVTESKECLDELIYCHQCNVPFECLDTYHTEWIPPLDKASLFDKIVTYENVPASRTLARLFLSAKLNRVSKFVGVASLTARSCRKAFFSRWN